MILKPVVVADWIACLLTVWEISHSNPGILPLLNACGECDWLPCWLPRGQQVSHQRWIWGIHCAQARKHASKGSTLALKPRADITRNPKPGCQRPHKKDLCPPKNFFKKDEIHACAYSGTCVGPEMGAPSHLRCSHSHTHLAHLGWEPHKDLTGWATNGISCSQSQSA